ncbi:hypothetical protein KGA65_16365 [Ideonella sp. B7]|uniref:hypothetical protein n=1 Tax=Ideonella benzenivorans TaxID=2831643 RepID=UPI001CEC94B9|nr:hypothetical protein [Ideonella benzenivorans]MCA6218110.1 hypothetical protein [Ideonella benzenivorans]
MALPSTDERYWLQIIGQMGSEVASALSAVQDDLDQLDPATPSLPSLPSLKKLQEDLARVRQIGMLGQQLARMAAGEVRQAPEEVSLTTLLRDALAQQKAQATLRGIELHRAMHPATVLLDPSLLHGFLVQLLDWGLAQAQDALSLRLELQGWPTAARLQLRASHPQPQALPPASAQALAWCLIEQMARTQHLPLTRQDGPDATLVQVDFPQTLASELDFDTDNAGEEASSLFALSQASRPLNGSHWLVIAAHRDLRAEVRDALRPNGMLVDFVGSIGEAERFCQESMPHGVLYEAILGGERMQALRSRLRAQAPRQVWVEISAEGLHCDDGHPTHDRPGRIGRDALGDRLPGLLEAEYTRSL